MNSQAATAVRLLTITAILAVFGCDSVGNEFGDQPPRRFNTEQPDSRLKLRRTRVPLADLVAAAPTVEMNPSGRAPMSARLVVQTSSPTTVVAGASCGSPYVVEPAAANLVHDVHVVGLCVGDSTIDFTIIDDQGQYAEGSLPVSVAPPPEFFPNIVVRSSEPGAMEPGWTLSEFTLANNGVFNTYPLAFDDTGVVRWYLDLSEKGGILSPVHILANGNLLIPFGHTLSEYDWLGNEVNAWSIPSHWQHHDVTEMPNGNFLVAVDVSGRDTVEDHLIELDRATGQIVTEWDLRQILDVDRRSFGGSDYDWFHMNSVWYSQSDDTIILSGRNQGVVKVSRQNELVWILAPHRGWGPAGMDGNGEDTSLKLLTAVDNAGNPLSPGVQDGGTLSPQFDWPWGQHAAMILPNGNLFLFDNGINRRFSNSPTPYSRGVEYEIDEASGTVRQVWTYGEERGPDFFSAIISDVDYLSATSNRLIMPGIVTTGAYPSAWVTEVTPGGHVVFDAQLQFKNRYSTGEITWGNFDLVYRSERVIPGVGP